MVARPATDAEAEEVFALAATFYVGYRNYRQRVGERRRIRVFVLEPGASPQRGLIDRSGTVASSPRSSTSQDRVGHGLGADPVAGVVLLALLVRAPAPASAVAVRPG